MNKNTDNLKSLLKAYNSLSDDQTYKLNSKIVLLEQGKIPIESEADIYIDLQVLSNTFLGNIFAQAPNLYKNGISILKEYANQEYIFDPQLIEDRNIDTHNIFKDNNKVFNFSPLTNGFHILEYILGLIEPINKHSSIKVIVNIFPLLLNQDNINLIPDLIQMLIHFPKRNVKVICKPYTEVFDIDNILYFSIYLIHNFKDFMDKGSFNEIANNFADKEIEYTESPLLSKYIFTDMRFLSNSVIQNKYKGNIKPVEKEIKLLEAYMNLFTNFSFIKIVPYYLDIKEKDTA